MGQATELESLCYEHRNHEVINGVQFGDLIDFVDFYEVAGRTSVKRGRVGDAVHRPVHLEERAKYHVTAPPWLSPGMTPRC